MPSGYELAQEQLRGMESHDLPDCDLQLERHLRAALYAGSSGTW